MTDAERWRLIRDMLGYLEDGSSESVTIDRDDATREWIIRVGNRTHYDISFDAVLRKAHTPR